MSKHLRLILDCAEMGFVIDDILSEIPILSLHPLLLYNHAIVALVEEDWYEGISLDGKFSVYTPTGGLLINAIEYIASYIRQRLDRAIPMTTVARVDLLSVYNDTLYLQLTLFGDIHNAQATL